MASLLLKGFLWTEQRAWMAGGFLLGLILFVATLVWPHHAMAQTTIITPTLGGMMCQMASQLMPGVGQPGLLSVINGVAYIGGAIIIGSGLLLLVRHYDGANDAPFYQPIARLIGGACLIAFPSFIQWLLNSVALAGPGGIAVAASPYSCTLSWAVTPVVGVTTFIETMVYNIKDPLTLLLSILAILIGVVYIFRGLVKASRYGTDPRTYSITAILTNLIVGAALVSLGTSLEFVFGTMFGGTFASGGCPAFSSVLSSCVFWRAFEANLGQGLALTGPDLQTFEANITAALTFFQLIGLIAFIRGWMVLKAYAEGTGQVTMAQGLTHIFGGAMAVNIYQMLMILDYTFGTGFL